MAMTIDTLQISNDMQKVGMNKPMADQLAETLRKTQIDSGEGNATKMDLEILRRDLIINMSCVIVFCTTVATGIIIWFFDKVISGHFPH